MSAILISNGTLEDCSLKINIEQIDKDLDKLKKTAACLEYLDTSECEGIVLKSSTLNNKATHSEIHPSFILSIMANQIIFPENNPFPRNAFSCGQGKQGVSMYHTNFHTHQVRDIQTMRSTELLSFKKQLCVSK